MADKLTPALEYHAQGRPGKIEVRSTKPCRTSHQLSLAYTPGVAEPCLEIKRNPQDVFRYTARGNLVAVITNGTAVLGLGNIGPLAGKPVMEGKGVLFKRFADIDVFDLELDTLDPDEFINTVKVLEPTFGGINLEDVKAPDCFYIEEKLKELMDIPVFHDDQHGTAIITTAALLNACELTGRKMSEVRIVVNGAGAAGIACADLAVKMGADKKNVIFCDTKGIVYRGRKEGMNRYKELWAVDTPARTLAEALVGADVVIGLSVKGALTGEMLQAMAKEPIIFAMANPDPEITPHEARAARADAIIATGRSDFPNQVNNVLGFPFIFRGALDVQARAINDEMKIAAAHALADLARQDVPDAVMKAYEGRRFSFGRDYIIPKPFDPRVLLWVAPAVAQAAMETGVARIKDFDLAGYRDRLERLLGPSNWIMRNIIRIAKQKPMDIVYPEGEDPSVLRAVMHVVEEGIANPILLGDTNVIQRTAEELQLDLTGCRILDPERMPDLERYVDALFDLRQRKGMTCQEAQRLMRVNPTYLGAVMVQMKEADGLVGGTSRNYPDAIRPVLQVMGHQMDTKVVAGANMVLLPDRVLFMADCTVNPDPNAEELTHIAQMTIHLARFFGVTPRVAMLSYSNFGSVRDAFTAKVSRATEMVRRANPEVEIDGEMQADTALNYDLIKESFSFSRLTKPANILIFPDLMSGNAAYKLVRDLAGAQVIGPLLMGVGGSFNVLQRGSDPETIVNLTAVTVCQARRIGSLGLVKD